MNAPEKDMVSYALVRNRGKRAPIKAIFCGVLILAILIYAAFFPFPQRVSRTLEALRFEGDGGDFTDGTPCTVEISGTVNRYLFRDDTFKGRLAFSTDETTCRADADADVDLQRGRFMSLFYFLDQEPFSIYTPGYILAPTDFDWLYARLKSESGAQYTITAGERNADEIRDLALKLSGQDALAALIGAGE